MNARVLVTVLVLSGQLWAGCGPAVKEAGPLTLGQAVLKIEKAGLGEVVRAEVKDGAFVITLADRTVVSVRPAAPKEAPAVEPASAKAVFRAGRYAEAAKAYEDAAARAGDPLDAVEALGGAIQCDAALGKAESIKTRLGAIEKVLPKLPPESRPDWERWVERVKEELARER